MGVRYEEDRKALGERGWWWWWGGTAVENYTTSINQLYPTVFLSSRVFPFPSLLHHTFSLLYLSFTVVHLPALVLRSHRSSPRLLPPGSFLLSPAPWALLRHRWSPSLPHSPSCFISTVVCLHAFFIDRPLFCCLPGIYPLSTGLY